MTANKLTSSQVQQLQQIPGPSRLTGSPTAAKSGRTTCGQASLLSVSGLPTETA